MNEFMKNGSVADDGTLANIREVFRHHSLKNKVMDNFQHVKDFVRVNKIFFFV